MLTVAAFQAAFTVFKKTDPTFIANTIARAQRWVDPCVWGDKVDDGVALLTAHWLIIDPKGTSTALKSNGRSTYGDQFEEMRAAIVGGFAGGGTW